MTASTSRSRRPASAADTQRDDDAGSGEGRSVSGLKSPTISEGAPKPGRVGNSVYPSTELLGFYKEGEDNADEVDLSEFLPSDDAIPSVTVPYHVYKAFHTTGSKRRLYQLELSAGDSVSTAKLRQLIAAADDAAAADDTKD